MLERLLSEMEAPEEKRLKRPRRLVACVHNAQRLPAVRELQRREQQGELDVIVFIPFGEKYEDFGKILEGMRMTWRRAKKRDYERMIVEVGPDVVLTLGWPFILTEASLAHKPRVLFLNSHPSLLPRHRGFSPFWGAIRDGDAEAGATVHEIAPGIDDGPILLQTAFPLDRFDTYLSVKRRTFACEADGVGPEGLLVRNRRRRGAAERSTGRSEQCAEAGGGMQAQAQTPEHHGPQAGAKRPGCCRV